MPDIKFIEYLKTLQPEEWDQQATSMWTVKDVVAHMIGWEQCDVEVIKKCWETKTPPWWKSKNEDDTFNARWVEHYKGYTPSELITEWEKWQKEVLQVMHDIGVENLKGRPDLFDWLFEGVDDNRSNGKDSHYKHHYHQIQKALHHVKDSL